MSKTDEVRKAMVEAMKAKDKDTKDTLSLLLSALKNKAIDKRAELTEEERHQKNENFLAKFNLLTMSKMKPVSSPAPCPTLLQHQAKPWPPLYPPQNQTTRTAPS